MNQPDEKALSKYEIDEKKMPITTILYLGALNECVCLGPALLDMGLSDDSFAYFAGGAATIALGLLTAGVAIHRTNKYHRPTVRKTRDKMSRLLFGKEYH